MHFLSLTVFVFCLLCPLAQPERIPEDVVFADVASFLAGTYQPKVAKVSYQRMLSVAIAQLEKMTSSSKIFSALQAKKTELESVTDILKSAVHLAPSSLAYSHKIVADDIFAEVVRFRLNTSIKTLSVQT